MTSFCDQNGATLRMKSSSRKYVATTATTHIPPAAQRRHAGRATSRKDAPAKATASATRGAVKSSTGGQGRPFGLWMKSYENSHRKRWDAFCSLEKSTVTAASSG